MPSVRPPPFGLKNVVSTPQPLIETLLAAVIKPAFSNNSLSSLFSNMTLRWWGNDNLYKKRVMWLIQPSCINE